MLKHKRWLRIIVPLCIGIVGCVAPATAATKTTSTSSSSSAALEAVAQSYNTAKPLQQGMMVQLDSKDKATVAPVSYKNAKQTYGVVVSPNNTPVSLSSSDGKQLAYVVTAGRYKVLTSTQNGTINGGDYVAISAIDGVAMKADTTESTVLGRAVSGFDGKKDILTTASLKSSDGKQVKAAIGMVTVDISVKPNPFHNSGDSGVPGVIQKLAVSVLGKPISAPQLYISAAIMLVGVGVVASLMYGGIQTSMTAIGRNPLAKQSIMRNMIQVIVAGIMIFIGCLVAVYLILKL